MRDKFYTILNGIGLTIGMAAALLIFMWVQDEMSFDNYHVNGNRAFRILSTYSYGGSDRTSCNTPSPLADAARESIGEIEKYARTRELWNTVLLHGDQQIGVKRASLVDAEFFGIFSFEFLAGDATSVFDHSSNAVITAGLAKRIFGTTEVVGQPLTLADKGEFVVSGVIEDLPSNTHLDFELLLPFQANVSKYMGEGSLHWNAYNFTSYVLLRPGIESQSVGKKLATLEPASDNNERTTFELQLLSDIHLGSGMLDYPDAKTGNLSNIKVIGIIGLLILLIACANYINISTARMSHRSKTTGIRKIVGASRWNLFVQYLTEAVVLISISSAIAVVLSNGCLDMFEVLSGKHFNSSQFYENSIVIILGTALITILCSAIKPALQLSAFKPMDAIRDNYNKSGSSKGGLRRVLVTTQFTCSGALIIATLVMLAQLDFVKKQNLGYDRDHIFTFHTRSSKALQLKNELLTQPGVEDVTCSDGSIVNIGSTYSGFDYEGKSTDADQYLWQLAADENFQKFFNVELAAGRWFLPGNDDTDSFIINESAAKELMMTDPIGKWIDFGGGRRTIVGVVKDFHFKSFHHEIEQLVIRQRPEWMRRVYIKTTSEDARHAIASAKEVFDRHSPNALFNYYFLDEAYDRLYKSEARHSKLFILFGGLAILISCLGLFGLSAYIAERRAKEIGIRKILGASVVSIVQMLSIDFLKLVLLALAIASPIAYFFVEGWLQDFAYRVDMKWWFFVVPTLIALLVALITISAQAGKAAFQNPIYSLRSE